MMDTALQIVALAGLLVGGAPTPALRAAEAPAGHHSLLDFTPATRALLEAPARDPRLPDPHPSGSRGNDSVANGVLIGAGIGLAGGLIASRIECGGNDAECETITRLAFVPLGAAGGAVIGWLIDRAR